MFCLRHLASTSIVGLACFGCMRPPSADDRYVSAIISDKVGGYVEWRAGACQDERIQTFIQCVLLSELSADAAIQIALLNNPKIQAVFEELDIARAGLVEAGLLTNPSFSLELRYPAVKGLQTNIEYLITSSLLDIFLIPLRTRLASTEFVQAKLRVSNEILTLAFNVRETYYELIAEKKKRSYISSVVELTSISNELFSRQNSVGNINSLEFQLSQSRLLEAELELSNSQAEMIRLTEKLNRLLGFTNEVCLILPDEILPEIDCQGFDLCALTSIALEERLDLQVARFEIIRLGQQLGLKEGWTYTHLQIGLAGERDPDGTNLIGPGFSGELPIFNYGQAARITLVAQLRQAQDRLAELEIKVFSEVREAHKLMMSYLEILNDYRYRLLPMYDQILATSEGLYNVMGLGVDKLIENKRQEAAANRNYIENVKKYLVAKVELDRALGGSLCRLLVHRECIQEVAE